MPSDTRPPIPGLTIRATPWGQPRVTAVCARDDCAWKYVGIDETATVDAARGHALASGHGVDVWRQDRRYVDTRDDSRKGRRDG
jgi:hypothetical protein